MKKSLSFLFTALGSVAVVSAQTTVATQGQVNGGAILSLLALAQVLVSRLVPFAIGLAVVVFFWYMIMFIVKGNSSADAKDASLKGMGYSILALFVMVSIWGIVGFLGSLSGIGQGGGAPTPSVPSYCDPTKAAGQPGAC